VWLQSRVTFASSPIDEPHARPGLHWSAHGLEAYCYRFNILPAGTPSYLGVQHFDEVAWAFDNVDGLGYLEVGEPSPFQDEPQSYKDADFLISASWASFVYDLDPNSWAG
jgi:hypothetical protein